MVIAYRGKVRPQAKLGQHHVVYDLLYPCLPVDTVRLYHLINCLHCIVFNYSIHSLNNFAIIRLFHFKIGNLKYSLNLTNLNRKIQSLWLNISNLMHRRSNKIDSSIYRFFILTVECTLLVSEAMKWTIL